MCQHTRSLHRLHAQCSNNFRHRKHQNLHTIVREKRREGKKIYQTSFALNTETFSAVCSADNLPRLWKSDPFVTMHFHVIFQFLNTSKEQYHIFLNRLTFARCLSPSLRSGSTLPLEIQNSLSWSFSACPWELSDCGVWSRTEGTHTASHK